MSEENRVEILEELQTPKSKHGGGASLFFILTVMVIGAFAFYNGPPSDANNTSVELNSIKPAGGNTIEQVVIEEQETPNYILTEQAKIHILYGDATGGGHIYGTKRPCKSMFPEEWDADKIISSVELLAANDNLNWRQQKNGKYVAEDKIDGVNVRVVMGSERTKVITSYPLNAERTPCPTANDNKKPLAEKPRPKELDKSSAFDKIRMEYKYIHNQ